jgi:hypothetical protein
MMIIVGISPEGANNSDNFTAGAGGGLTMYQEVKA